MRLMIGHVQIARDEEEKEEQPFNKSTVIIIKNQFECIQWKGKRSEIQMRAHKRCETEKRFKPPHTQKIVCYPFSHENCWRTSESSV